MAVSTLSVQDVYARAGRTPSTSARATAGAVRSAPAATGEAISGDLARAFNVAAASNPLYGVAVLAVMLVGLALLSQRAGTIEDFRQIRLGVYNVVVISLAAIIGILFWKTLLTRFPIPHLTPAVLAV